MGFLRRRLLILWQAIDMGRSLPAPPLPPPGSHQHPPSPPNTSYMDRTELLALITTATHGPEELVEGTGHAPHGSHGSHGSVGQQRRVHVRLGPHSSGVSGPLARAVAWLPLSVRAGVWPSGLAMPLWETQRTAVLEAGLSAAKQGQSHVDTWEIADALLRWGTHTRFTHRTAYM